MSVEISDLFFLFLRSVWLDVFQLEGIDFVSCLYFLEPFEGLGPETFPARSGRRLLHPVILISPVVGLTDILLILLASVCVAHFSGSDPQKRTILLADGVQLQIFHEEFL